MYVYSLKTARAHTHSRKKNEKCEGRKEDMNDKHQKNTQWKTRDVRHKYSARLECMHNDNQEIACHLYVHVRL